MQGGLSGRLVPYQALYQGRLEVSLWGVQLTLLMLQIHLTLVCEPQVCEPQACTDLLLPWLVMQDTHASSVDRRHVHAQGTQEATTIEKTCSAQLDGAALEAILAQGPAWEGLRASAQDVWAGHKEDPQKVN